MLAGGVMGAYIAQNYNVSQAQHVRQLREKRQ